MEKEECEESCLYQGHKNSDFKNYIQLMISLGRLPEGCLTCVKNEENKNCIKHYFVKDNQKESALLEMINLNKKFFEGNVPKYSLKS